MKSKERKVLITNEGEIRVGDLLELRACRRCGSAHRQLILASKRFGDDPILYFCVTNKCPPYRWVHYRDAIAKRRLYRIDTGLLDEENPYNAVKKPASAAVNQEIERLRKMCQEYRQQRDNEQKERR